MPLSKNIHHVVYLYYKNEESKGGKIVEENILKVEWVDFETADKLLPYYNDFEQLLTTEGIPYALQK